MDSLNQPFKTETDQSLFEMQVDHESNGYLSEIAKWAKFLSIVGFIWTGLVFLAFLRILFAGSELDTTFTFAIGTSKTMVAACLFIFIGLTFFPSLYLFQFSKKMQFALRNNDQYTLNTAFNSLKTYFKFVGILTIVILSIYVLIIIIALGIGLSR